MNDIEVVAAAHRLCVCRLLYYEVTGSLVDRCPLELLPLRVYLWIIIKESGEI